MHNNDIRQPYPPKLLRLAVLEERVARISAQVVRLERDLAEEVSNALGKAIDKGLPWESGRPQAFFAEVRRVADSEDRAGAAA